MEDKVDFIATQFDKKLMASKEKDHSNHYATAAEMVHFFVKEIDKSKVYLTWIVRQYAEGAFMMEDADSIRETLTLFTKVKSKLESKDLNTYTLSHLYDVLEPYDEIADDEDMLYDVGELKKKKDAELFMDEPDFKVLIPKTEEASSRYGKNCKWCTSRDDAKTQFQHYSDAGNLMIIITKFNGKLRKFQVHFEKDQFMCEKNMPIGKGDIGELSKNPHYKTFLNKLIKKHYSIHLKDHI